MRFQTANNNVIALPLNDRLERVNLHEKYDYPSLRVAVVWSVLSQGIALPLNDRLERVNLHEKYDYPSLRVAVVWSVLSQGIAQHTFKMLPSFSH